MEHGKKVMNLQFFLEGPSDKGKVFVEARQVLLIFYSFVVTRQMKLYLCASPFQDSEGVYEMTRIVLQLNNRPYSPIIVLDKK